VSSGPPRAKSETLSQKKKKDLCNLPNDTSKKIHSSRVSSNRAENIAPVALASITASLPSPAKEKSKKLQKENITVTFRRLTFMQN
jgi:hypothetical protein